MSKTELAAYPLSYSSYVTDLLCTMEYDVFIGTSHSATLCGIHKPLAAFLLRLNHLGLW